MNDVQKAAFSIGVIPVIAIDDAEKAVPLARALLAGGLPAAEVTFRTAAGEEAIRRIAAEVPEVLVGAGTVLNLEQCDRALAAGAKFIVSPGYNEALVAHCQEKGVLVLPGCVNASDMTRAANAGLEYVKFFPAEQSGGVNGIKALAPVFPKLNFMPTGGVNTKNLMDYLGYDRIVACGGTWMLPADAIREKNFAAVRPVRRGCARDARLYPAARGHEYLRPAGGPANCRRLCRAVWLAGNRPARCRVCRHNAGGGEKAFPWHARPHCRGSERH